jgi:3-hydroxybutyryl-CoA dehydrogenase
MPEITSVGVLGCGLMGSGIAQTAAAAGFSTTVRDVSEALLHQGRNTIARSLAKLVEKARLDPAARDGALERLRFTTELDELQDSDIVIEAVSEDLALKNELWRALDAR